MNQSVLKYNLVESFQLLRLCWEQVIKRISNENWYLDSQHRGQSLTAPHSWVILLRLIAGGAPLNLGKQG